jgi:hypothetical protein
MPAFDPQGAAAETQPAHAAGLAADAAAMDTSTAAQTAPAAAAPRPAAAAPGEAESIFASAGSALAPPAPTPATDPLRAAVITPTNIPEETTESCATSARAVAGPPEDAVSVTAPEPAKGPAVVTPNGDNTPVLQPGQATEPMPSIQMPPRLDCSVRLENGAAAQCIPSPFTQYGANLTPVPTGHTGPPELVRQHSLGSIMEPNTAALQGHEAAVAAAAAQQHVQQGQLEEQQRQYGCRPRSTTLRLQIPQVPQNVNIVYAEDLNAAGEFCLSPFDAAAVISSLSSASPSPQYTESYHGIAGVHGGQSPLDPVSKPLAQVSTKSKRCTCKKTHCLKLYCECFAAGDFCTPGYCKCGDCSNLHEFRERRVAAVQKLLKRKGADAFRRVSVEKERTIAAATGCKCRKSGCVKNYCECYHAGLKCSSKCRCDGCKNCSENRAKKGNKQEAKPGAVEVAGAVASAIEVKKVIVVGRRTGTKRQRGSAVGELTM